MSKTNKTYAEDLKFLLIASCTAVIFALVPILNEIPLRTLFTLPYAFFITGYAITTAIFPSKEDITGIERFTISIGLSILIVIFNAFGITLLQWELGQSSLMLSLSFLTIIFSILAYISRGRLSQEKQFHISYIILVDFIHTLLIEPSDSHRNNEYSHDIKQTNERKFKSLNRSKISAIQIPTKEKVVSSIESLPKDIFPILTKALIIALVASTILASAMFVHSKVTEEKQKTTALYILGPNGEAKEYPSTISMTQATNIIVGIENYELEPVNYTLEVILGGNRINQTNVFLEDNEKWEHEISFKPTIYKMGEQKLEFILHKERSSSYYRTVYLWVTQELEEKMLYETSTEVLDFIKIDNPSMESNNSWIFISTNEENTTGSYVKGSGPYSTQAYQIYSTYEGTSEIKGVHSIRQEIYSNNTELVLLSVFLKDTYTKGTSGKSENQFKQVLLNGDIIWSDGVNGNEGWQHLHLPVTVVEGKNTLQFCLVQTRGEKIYPVKLIIDDISFLPLSELSPYILDDSTVEFVLPTSNVTALPATVSTENFTVKWQGTDVGSGILYYDIDYSTDGKKWKRWLSSTTKTSSLFEGEEDYTYYFRSKATDKALNKESEHIYADAYTYVDNNAPRISLDITPNPTTKYAYLTVESTKPLQELTCLVTPQTFGSSEYITMTSSKDKSIWKGTYKVEIEDNFYVEIVGKDNAGNTAYTFGTIYTADSLEELDITVYPTKITGDEATIMIVPSVALENEPIVTVKDAKGRSHEVIYKGFSDGFYAYVVEMDDSTSDGYAEITAKATTVNSENLYEETTFFINRYEDD